jgi:lon-related putative ATP-dependent protease
VTGEEAKLRFDPGRFDFPDTSRLPEQERVVGQELAIEAIEFALDIDSGDFHLFAAGPPGTGRATVVKNMAARAARRRPVPDDVCCVYNFSDPERPETIQLPAGSGRVFAAEMERLDDFMRRAIPAALSSRDYRARYQSILETHLDARRERFSDLDERATALGIHVEDTPANIHVVPLGADGSEMSEEDYDALTDAERKAIEEKERALRDDILEYLDAARALQDEAEEELAALDRQTVTRLVEPRITHIREVLRFAEVHAWLDDVMEDAVQTLQTFLPPDDVEGGGLAEALRGPGAPPERYAVNVMVDNSGLEGAPVVMELNPTYGALVGKVERRMAFGAMETNHTLVRAGALHRANGGFLILDAAELLSHPYSYPALKRALREGACTIQDIEDFGGGPSTITLSPAPVPIRVQVIFIGSLDDYIVLRSLDSEFAKLVKVRADFDDSADLGDDAATWFARFIGSVCRERGLRHFSPSGVAAMIEQSSRLAGRKDELSLHLDALRSMVVEAEYWSRADGAKLVDRVHVERCSAQMRRRSSLFLRRTLKAFERESLLVSVTGCQIGQVNGLAVLGVGDILFGVPARITAKTFAGETGVVNIERETELSGQIHSKAVLILNGYLGWRYARDRPLSLGASITFEQNYSMIEGDSATIAELVALLSSLSGIPVRQDRAITGSMSQHGEVQPIGGVNEKVEGFFGVCAMRGLTGSQGVVVPIQNVPELNLDDDVVRAIDAGQFHVWAVRTVEDAIALLLDTEPGDCEGVIPPGPDTVHGRVVARLAEMSAAVQKER